MENKKESSLKAVDIIKKYKELLPNKGILLMALLLLFLNTGISLLIPYLTMNIIDGINLKNFNIKSFLFFAIILIISMIIAVITSLVINNIGETTVRNLRSKLWKKILYLHISFFDNNSTGELMSRISNDTQILRDFISFTLSIFISSIITVVGSFALLWLIDWKMAVVLCISVPLATGLIMFVGGREYKISRILQDTYASWQGDMHRIISDIRLVKASATEEIEVNNGIKKIENLRKLNMKEAKISALIQPFSSTLVLLLLIINVGYGGLRVSEGTFTTGAFVASLSYLFKLTQPMAEIMQFFTSYQKFLGAFAHIHDILSFDIESPTIVSRYEQEKVKTKRNSLFFQNVSFQYNENVPIINGISFEADEGQVTGIVGPSGAGKTTIFSLVERFYKLTSGAIYYNNNNINEYDLYEWRKKIAYVFQDSPMMYGTIVYNLTYGIDNYNQKEIDQALQNANLSELIESLPNGLNTEIGDKGIKLSGGERQRLAIARAMIKNPKILLLDEATAHLDSESERLVQDSLDKLMHGRTTLVIAHRLSTIKNAAKLIILENGAISGIGTHDELMQTNELYQKFVYQQIKK